MMMRCDDWYDAAVSVPKFAPQNYQCHVKFPHHIFVAAILSVDLCHHGITSERFQIAKTVYQMKRRVNLLNGI